MSVEGGSLTLRVSDRGPFESIDALAEGCRLLVREELLEAAHARSWDRLAKLDWRGVYIESTLQRWRTPDPVPRQIRTCGEFDMELAALPPDGREAVRAVLRLVEAGGDLTPLLSKWATRAHPKRRDRFLADWQLHHIHVTPDSGDLLFIHFTRECAYVVALRPHDSWAERELAHRVQRHWPGLIFGGTLAGFRPERTVTDPELKALQQAGVYTIFTDEQGMAMAGRGLTASGHPLDLVDAANHLEHVLWLLERGEVIDGREAPQWLPCLTDDLRQLGLWNANREQIRWLASLWPFPA